MTATSIAVAQVAGRLAAAGVDEPRREARLILAAALGMDAAGLLLRDAVDEALYEPLVQRREAREPLAYILGRREFWGLMFEVSPATLIPRPDSEALVEAALALKPDARRVLDLGTGTGCLLLAVLHELPAAFGFGVDLAPAAAMLAGKNARSLKLAHRATFCAGDWAAAIEGRFDLILSNPPYIAAGDIARLMPEVARHEPVSALDGGADGLDAYRQITTALPELLADGGIAVVEIGAGQSTSIAKLTTQAGLTCETRPDLAGIERAAILAYAK